MSSENAEAPFSYTEKTPAGNLFTIRGDDYQKFFENLTAVANDPDLVATLTAVHSALGHSAAGSVDQGNPRGGSVEQQGTPNQPSTSGGGSCQHGERVLKSGNKNGRDWSGWFCPASDKMCKPNWNK